MNIQRSLLNGDEVDRRLQIVSELRNLCLSLGKAERLSNGAKTNATSETGADEPPALDDSPPKDHCAGASPNGLSLR